jgi:hypothetical protein
MPPLFIPPLVKLTLGVLGAGAIVTWVVKEMRRMNQELDRVKAGTALDPPGREGLPTLRRDPRTGHWRVM